MKVLILCLVLISPLFAIPISRHVNEEEMWWCSGCNLAYPASTKFCLNKNCPLYRVKK